MNSEKNYIYNRKNLFFDTYAFFEILKGNPKYERYKKFEIITSKLNIFELYLGILREVSRSAFQKKGNKFSTLKDAFNDVQERLKIHIDNFLTKSFLLQNYGKQKKLSQFF